MILDLLENAELDENLNLKYLLNLAAIIALPAVVYHKAFMEEFGARIVAATKKRLLGN